MTDAELSPPAVCLWFDDQALDAATLYTQLIPGSEITNVMYNGEATRGEPGTVLMVNFTLGGREFQALNGGKHYTLTPAASLVLNRDTQAEIDHLWDSLLADGGEESMCGWLTDRFGLSWQIIPSQLGSLLGSQADGGAAGARAMKAMFEMRKLDIAALQAAHDGV